MKTLNIFTLLILIGVFVKPAYSGIELLVGANIGKISFDSETPIDNHFEGTSTGFQATARGTLTTGRFQIGAGVTTSTGKSKLEAKSGDDLNSDYKHLFYGPVFGYIVNPNLRIDFEYYTDSTIEFTKANSSLFNEDDKIFGKGLGIGASLLQGHLVTQVLYQRFMPSKVEISGEEFDAESNEASQFSIQSIALQIGFLY